METQIPKLPNEDTTRTTTSHDDNTTRSNTDAVQTSDAIVENLASLRVSKSDPFPMDLIVEILKRLPVKTLARCLCVSKVWGSTIRSPDFRKLFHIESAKKTRPGRLNFNFSREKVCIFFSANQTLTPGEHSVATYHTTSPVYRNTTNFSSLHDLVCYGTACGTQLVVYNSTTKKSITLPKFKSGTYVFKHFLCYDPIDAVYKVLCMFTKVPKPIFRVLTLGNGSSWKVIKNRHSHVPFMSQICTDGVLYYDAHTDMGFTEVIVMRFDVRSEKFDLIKGPVAPGFPLDCLSNMTRYKGKLAIISTEISANGGMVLWVLEDAVKHQWSKKVIVLPNSWKSLAQETPLASTPNELHLFLNITAAGEFILAPLSTCAPPFYVIYYDPKRNSVRKVSIQGILNHELLQWNGEEPWFLYHLFCSEVDSLMFW